MSRWPAGARERLERAALELFAEQGFSQTTVPQITARADLTTRTFFRHFADKREVLFGSEAELPHLVTRLMAETPLSLSPLQLMTRGLHTLAAARFEGRREQLRARRAVIEADEGLRERELRKLAVLSDAIRQGFRDRGVEEPTATVAAQIGISVLNVSISRWLSSNDDVSLSDHIDETLAALASLTAAIQTPAALARDADG